MALYFSAAKSKTRLPTILLMNPCINSILNLDVKLSCQHGGLTANKDKLFVHPMWGVIQVATGKTMEVFHTRRPQIPYLDSRISELPQFHILPLPILLH